MVAGLTAMEKMTEEEFARLESLGDHLREGLAEAMDGARVQGQVTGKGSLFHVHLHQRPLTDYRSSYPTLAEQERTAAIYRSLLAHGILTTPGLMGCLSTPMGETEIQTAVDAFAAALEETA
jgi:glutamate-1-semialdehyde 2,1-aminomutase